MSEGDCGSMYVREDALMGYELDGSFDLVHVS